MLVILELVKTPKGWGAARDIACMSGLRRKLHRVSGPRALATLPSIWLAIFPAASPVSSAKTAFSRSVSAATCSRCLYPSAKNSGDASENLQRFQRRIHVGGPESL
jgi:hypothetical protein